MKKIIVLIIALMGSFIVNAQTGNSASEIMDYREVDGRIVLKVMVNGVEGDFLLDLAGHNSILKEKISKFKIDTTDVTTFNGYSTHQFKQVSVGKVYIADNVSFGNNVFGNRVKFFELIDEPYLRELGIDGILNSVLFTATVLTIDTKRAKITTTIPFRPPYMKLDHRANMELGRGQSINFDITIDNQSNNVILDTWNKTAVSLNKSDYDKIANGKKVSQNGVASRGYGKDYVAERQISANLSFVKSTFEGISIVENSTLSRSVVGLDLLKLGIVSIDFSKDKIYFQPHDLVKIDDESLKTKEIEITNGKLNPITRDYFIENIYDYKKGGAFVSKSDKPIVIDFWATWCGPCMRLLPQMEALAEKYKDQVVFMKVNADKEKELCNAFNVQALPTIFFIPAGGKPIVEIGATFEKFEEIIIKKLLKK